MVQLWHRGKLLHDNSVLLHASVMLGSSKTHLLMRVCQCFLSAEFQSTEPDLYLEVASKTDCESWVVALGEANSEDLRNKIQSLIMELKEGRMVDEAQHFLPSEQANDLTEPKLVTSKHCCLLHPS